MKTLTLTVHSDPGHAWLQVPISLINELGIADKISRFSYMDAENGYLEEDCDFGVFTEAAKSQGYELTFNEDFKEDTPIRSMPSFTAV